MITIKKIAIFTFSILIMQTVVGQNFDKLKKYLDNKVTGVVSPGVQYIVADASGILFEYNEGVANIQKNTEIVKQTQFKMYSSTKLLTMLSIMRLVEKGLVDLDAPVSKYLDIKFPDSVTVRKTLSHTAGFSKYPFIKEIHLANERKGFTNSDFLKENLTAHSELAYAPGSKNVYSNAGYMVLSAIVEKVSGMSYENYVKENIISKVQLSDNDYIGFEYSDKTATGYQRRKTLMHWLYTIMLDTDKFYGSKTSKWQSYNNLYNEGISFSGGFANATALATLFRAVMKNSILSKETLNQTFEPQYYNSTKQSKQALGWWIGKVNGHINYHHAGGGGGYSCEVCIYPEIGIVRIMMMNKTQTFGDLKMFQKMDELWLD